eukprot:COSAG01_NODE_8332_length_2825_cov_2.895451_3_plen_137_part_00
MQPESAPPSEPAASGKEAGRDRPAAMEAQAQPASGGTAVVGSVRKLVSLTKSGRSLLSATGGGSGYGAGFNGLLAAGSEATAAAERSREDVTSVASRLFGPRMSSEAAAAAAAHENTHGVDGDAATGARQDAQVRY